jgi:hypothetical protein
MISLIARHSNGLPAKVIPYEMHSIGRVVMIYLCQQLLLVLKNIILLNPKNSEDYSFLPKQG